MDKDNKPCRVVLSNENSLTDKKFKSSFTYIWALSLTIKECGMLNHSLNRLYLKLHHLSMRVELFYVYLMYRKENSTGSHDLTVTLGWRC